eukprot:m.1216 g.1216  ORF g.1216 m.1216 type:complete len:794 (+) comp5898_c0_seq1:23-2404(+)
MSSGEGETNVKVVVRIRPPTAIEQQGKYAGTSVIRALDDQIAVFDPTEDVDIFQDNPKADFHTQLSRRGPRKTHRDTRFVFDGVFDETAPQEVVHANTTKGIVDRLFEGINCSVFAYGATGAGKTHTMLGTNDNPGVVFRTMIELYEAIEAKRDEVNCTVVASYAEIYNEQIRDLLVPSGNLPMRENAGKVGISGLSKHKPQSANEVLEMLAKGTGNRTQHPTDANAQSSRSHAVFQVFLQQKQRRTDAGILTQMKVAKMSLIDLAGSERATMTTNRGMRLREGANINRSLLALGNCINALAEQKKGDKVGHVPYRDSKLTRLLKDSLGGSCYTVMIANVSPSFLSYEDTYNTLKYADRARNIKSMLVSNTVNVDIHVTKYKSLIEDLQSEVMQLKQKLQETSSSSSAANILPITPCYSFPSSHLTCLDELTTAFEAKRVVSLDIIDVDSAQNEADAKQLQNGQMLERLQNWMPDSLETFDSSVFEKRQQELAERKTELAKRLGGCEGAINELTKKLGCMPSSHSLAAEYSKRLEADIQRDMAVRRNEHTMVLLQKQRKHTENTQRLLCQVLQQYRQSSSPVFSDVTRMIKSKGKEVAFSDKMVDSLPSITSSSVTLRTPAIAISTGILTSSMKLKKSFSTPNLSEKSVASNIPLLPPPPSSQRTPRRLRRRVPLTSHQENEVDVTDLFQPLVIPKTPEKFSMREEKRSPFQPSNSKSRSTTPAKSPRNLPQRIPVKKKTRDLKRSSQKIFGTEAKRAAPCMEILTSSSKKKRLATPAKIPRTPGKSEWRIFP